MDEKKGTREKISVKSKRCLGVKLTCNTKCMWEGSRPLLEHNDKSDSKFMTVSAKGRKQLVIDLWSHLL